MTARLAEAAVLNTPAGRALVARLTAATDAEYPRRKQHVRATALVVIRAKGLT